VKGYHRRTVSRLVKGIGEAAMSRLDVFAAMVKSLEQGKPLPGWTERSTAVRVLIDWVCFAPWETQEELDKAQALVGRLCGLWELHDAG
jgi:hypothetical protein